MATVLRLSQRERTDTGVTHHRVYQYLTLERVESRGREVGDGYFTVNTKPPNTSHTQTSKHPCASPKVLGKEIWMWGVRAP